MGKADEVAGVGATLDVSDNDAIVLGDEIEHLDTQVREAGTKQCESGRIALTTWPDERMVQHEVLRHDVIPDFGPPQTRNLLDNLDNTP